MLAVRGLVSIHIAVARTLLSASPDPEMTARVAALQDSRARIIAAADAERRRLERDLHDGAQQRLVALSMQLGLAKRRLAKGEDVGDLVVTADAEAKAAIDELRDLARGLHPAVLTDRGLAPALRDVATRSAVPVELGELPEERLPGPVEAAAYFTVSEALTNVAKYAQATQRPRRGRPARRRARHRGRRRRRRRRLAGRRIGPARPRRPARRARRRARGRVAARGGDHAARADPDRRAGAGAGRGGRSRRGGDRR